MWEGTGQDILQGGAVCREPVRRRRTGWSHGAQPWPLGASPGEILKLLEPKSHPKALRSDARGWDQASTAVRRLRVSNEGPWWRTQGCMELAQRSLPEFPKYL